MKSLHDKLIAELEGVYLEGRRFSTRCKFQKILKEIQSIKKDVYLKSIDEMYYRQYNQVMRELSEGKVKLRPVRTLSWTRWFGSWWYGKSSWKAPDYFTNRVN
jgi:hypothetical protein